MSLATPTVSTINDNIIAQLSSSLGQAIPILPKSFLRVLSKTLAGVIILLYKYAGFMFLQWFVRTAAYAEIEVNGTLINPLLEWGNLVGIGDRTAATYAELEIAVTVENQTGSLLSGTQLLGPSNGITYITLSTVALDAATVYVTVRAAADQTDTGGAGTAGNLVIDDALSFANAIANVSRTAVVNSVVTTAADAEDIEVYRQRIYDRFQKRPQGGAYADYQEWGEEAAGIINVYPYTGNPGQVDVYCEATVASSGSADGIPTTAQLEDVLDLINYNSGGLANRRSANAFVNVYAITRSGFDVTVNGIASVDDETQVQNDIESALDDYFASIEPFIVGLSVLPRVDQLTRTRIAAIVEDVVSAAGGTYNIATFTETGSSLTLASYIVSEGEKTKMSNLYFT